MSAFTWICVFLLVGLLNSPVNGDNDNDNDNDNEDGNGNLGFFQFGEDNDDDEDDRAIRPVPGEIHKLQEIMGHCLNEKKIPCLLNFYANDVIVVPDGYPSFQGSHYLESALSWINAVTVTKHPATHIEPIGPNAEYVLEVHPYDVDGPSGHIKGKSALIWKRIHGHYKIIFQMSNDEY